jgi:hypothetical protein
MVNNASTTTPTRNEWPAYRYTLPCNITLSDVMEGRGWFGEKIKIGAISPLDRLVLL